MISLSTNAQLGQALFRQALRSCRRYLVAAAGFSAVVNLLYLAPTLYLLLVYDRVIPTSGLATLVIVSLVTLFAFVVLAALEALRSRLLVWTGARLDQALAREVLAAILAPGRLDPTRRTQALRHFDTVRHALAGQGVLAVFDFPWAPIYIVAAFLLHPAIGALSLVSAGVLAALAWRNEVATRSPLTGVAAAAARAYARQDRATAAVDEAAALGMVPALVERHIGDRRHLIALQMRASFTAVSYSTAIRFVRLVLQSAVLGLGAYLTIINQITPGAVVAGSLLLSRALAPIEQIVASWSALAQARIAYDELVEVLGAQAARPAHTALPPPSGAVALEGVRCVVGDAKVALEPVSLAIPAGAFIGVVGLSGAGKSTLLRVLAGALGPTEGVVRYDGATLAEWGPQLARHVGYLPQGFTLLDGTIRDNISRFEAFSGAVDAEAIDRLTVAAAMAAGVHETILRLPAGYQTRIEGGGAGLSAGETQRVALARALYRQPRVVVLDEPNAHLDSDAEQRLLETLAALKAAGATLVVSAHRPAILAGADKLLLLNAGRVELFGALSDVAAEMRARTEPARRGATAELREA
jgi:ATP-binding cassette subfamily C protein